MPEHRMFEPDQRHGVQESTGARKTKQAMQNDSRKRPNTTSLVSSLRDELCDAQ